MILGHHGGEIPLLQALAAAGSLSLVLAVLRIELSALGRRFRRPRSRDRKARGDGATTNPGGGR